MRKKNIFIGMHDLKELHESLKRQEGEKHGK